MSNEANQTSSLPVDPQMPGSTGKSLSLPISADPSFYASKADETLIRLAKLIKTTAGLGSLLSVSAYSLYIAAYLHAKSPSRGEILARISHYLGRPTPKIAATSRPTVSPFAPAIGIINDTRFSIRLTGLIPMYVALRGLLKTRNPKDGITHKLAILQMSMFVTFQIMENLWLLSSKAIIAPQWLQKIGGPGKLLSWCCRAWLVALSCDFARLFREAYIVKEDGLEKTMSQEEKNKSDVKWWTEFFTASAWYPMAIHYSVDGGIGLNQGMIGMSGMLGGLAGLSKAWAATKD